ncbi:glycosyltransferase family 2 protein [Candidatus Roizmanbacteria bacterium]|nr:glycosyltransferase family 2 protein [Candidatus Roizmanbacteria bacterium]
MLSVVLATFNEEKNIARCLEAVKNLAEEIIVVDGGSVDKTVEIAKKYGAKVTVTDNPPIFHINKQKAVDLAKGDWVLQLDADEVVTDDLKKEIREVIKSKNAADGYCLKRRNYFLGKWLQKGGQYPDPVIRLFQKSKGKFPCKSVHEQIEINGEVETLKNDLLHDTAPTLARYLSNNDRYAALTAQEFKEEKIPLNILTALKYLLIKPVYTFLLLFIRHKGFRDGYPGFIFAFYSGFLFAKAYLKYSKQRTVNR